MASRLMYELQTTTLTVMVALLAVGTLVAYTRPETDGLSIQLRYCCILFMHAWIYFWDSQKWTWLS